MGERLSICLGMRQFAQQLRFLACLLARSLANDLKSSAVNDTNENKEEDRSERQNAQRDTMGATETSLFARLCSNNLTRYKANLLIPGSAKIPLNISMKCVTEAGMET